MKDKLIELIKESVGGCATYWASLIADHLIENGVTVQRWISVDERLPEKSGTYACLTRIKTGLVLVLALDYSAKHKKFNAFDSLSEQLADSYSINVTHWQPLPEPKKEEK